MVQSLHMSITLWMAGAGVVQLDSKGRGERRPQSRSKLGPPVRSDVARHAQLGDPVEDAEISTGSHIG